MAIRDDGIKLAAGLTAPDLAAMRPIPGTTLFDGVMARRGIALNAMCYGFNDAGERAAFQADEQGYCRAHGLTDAQCRAVAARDVLELIAQGGNIYYLAKLAGIWGLSVQDLGAAQTGMTVDQFKAMLLAQGTTVRGGRAVAA